MNWIRRSWSPRRNTPGVVYILSGDNGFYKIGSSKRLEKRVWEIQHYTGIQVKIYFYTTTDNMSYLENKLHSVFSNKRVFNEWFDLTPEDLALAIRTMQETE